MATPVIVPAYIPRSLEEVFAVAKRVKSFTRELHIDAVDGVFADTMSWPYGSGVGSGSPHEARTLADMFDIEFDLMVADTLSELPRYLAARPKRVVVHLESCVDVAQALELAHEAGALLGLAAGNDTPLDFFLDELAHADFAQCMGIATVGSQGQPCDERVFDRIASVRARYPEYAVSVDGAVNQGSIVQIAATGVARLIVGSAIIQQQDPMQAYQDLVAAVS
jgi:ribulose-phosphate 3-epimerase